MATDFSSFSFIFISRRFAGFSWRLIYHFLPGRRYCFHYRAALSLGRSSRHFTSEIDFFFLHFLAASIINICDTFITILYTQSEVWPRGMASPRCVLYKNSHYKLSRRASGELPSLLLLFHAPRAVDALRYFTSFRADMMADFGGDIYARCAAALYQLHITLHACRRSPA